MKSSFSLPRTIFPPISLKPPSTGPGGGGVVLWDISVNNDQATQAMALLDANGLPRRKGQKLLDIFTTSGLVPSEMAEKIRYQSGLAAQIANTIRKIDGVVDADVQLSFPQEDPLNPMAEKPPVTASVFVKHNGVLDDPNSQLIPKIRQLVAAAVQGLSYENVTVIPVRARLIESAQQQNQVYSADEFEKVWMVSVAKDSVGTFQVLFFSFITITGLALLSTLWMVWKILPVARKCGGFRYIFTMTPLKLPEASPQEGAEDIGKKKVEPKNPDDKKPRVQENVESE